MGVDAVGAAAVGHHLGIVAEAPQADARAPRAGQSGRPGCARRELDARSHVDHHDVAAVEPGEKLLAADCLDLVAQVVAGGALDVSHARLGHLAQRKPERDDVIAGGPVMDACPLAPGHHEAPLGAGPGGAGRRSPPTTPPPPRAARRSARPGTTGRASPGAVRCQEPGRPAPDARRGASWLSRGSRPHSIIQLITWSSQSAPVLGRRRCSSPVVGQTRAEFSLEPEPLGIANYRQVGEWRLAGLPVRVGAE